MIRPRQHLLSVPPCPHGSFSYREGKDRSMSAAEVIDFSASCNPLGASPGVLEAVRSVDPSRYPDDEALELRSALAAATGLGVEWIAAGNGSVELIYQLAGAYLEPGDRALVVGPTFGEYERACRVAGADVLEVRAREESGFRPDMAAVSDVILRELPKLVFLCNPNNPTGQLLPPPAIEGLLESREESLLVVDEAYLPFCDEAVDLTPYLSSGRLLLLRSLTKDHGLAGMRLGYALAPPELLDPIGRIRPPWTVNATAQAAGIAALADGAHLQAARRLVRKACFYLTGELSMLGLGVVPSAANFLLVRVGDGAAFRSALLEHGICVRDCASFGLPAFVRIAARTMPDCEKLVAAVREVVRDA